MFGKILLFTSPNPCYKRREATNSIEKAEPLIGRPTLEVGSTTDIVLSV
jgi:hypothetical protein